MMNTPKYPVVEEVSAETGDVVLDTSILMDCLFTERLGHARAVLVARTLQRQGWSVFIPAHFYFELVSAILCERRVRSRLLAIGELKGRIPFPYYVVTLDERFAIDYLIPPFAAGQVIDLKGGDMIFAALALGQRMPLITEDRKMRAEVLRLGGWCFTIEEYLAEVSSFCVEDETQAKPDT
jgi:predicted nucleic acid-binding protein